MNWKRLTPDPELLGEPLLLRESHPYSANVCYYVGILFADQGGYGLRDYHGNVFRLHEDYTYHVIEVRAIKF